MGILKGLAGISSDCKGMLTPKCSEWEKTPSGTHPQKILEHQRKKWVSRNSHRKENQKDPL